MKRLDKFIKREAFTREGVEFTAVGAGMVSFGIACMLAVNVAQDIIKEMTEPCRVMELSYITGTGETLITCKTADGTPYYFSAEAEGVSTYLYKKHVIRFDSEGNVIGLQ